MTNGAGQVVQQTDFYSFGMPFTNNVGEHVQPYLFGGKEYDPMHGLNQYHFESRQLDSETNQFTTPDAHAENYYEWSPYVPFGNNPMLITDPTGMDWEMKMEEDENGYRKYYFTLTGVVYNNSSKYISMDGLLTGIQQQLNDIFNTSGDDYSVSFSSNLRIVDSVEDIGETDHVFQVVDDTNLGKGAAASADLGGLNIRIGTKAANETSLGINNRTVGHEVGHTAGLGHPYDLPRHPLNPREWKDNLMAQSKYVDIADKTNPNGARNLTSGQITQMWNNRNFINKNSLVQNKIKLRSTSSFPFFNFTTQKQLKK